MTGRKKLEREVVMKTDLEMDEGFIYKCEANEEGKLVVVRHRKQSYKFKKEKGEASQPEPAKGAEGEAKTE